MVENQKKDQLNVYRLESGFRFDRKEESEKSNETPYSSMIGKQICKDVEKYNAHQATTLTIHDGNEIINIRTSSIQRLVKKFARRIFKQFKINIKYGKYLSDNTD